MDFDTSKYLEIIKKHEFGENHIRDLLKSPIFVDHLFVKHRVVVEDFLKNLQIDEAIQYFLKSDHQLIALEAICKIEQTKLLITEHHNAKYIQFQKYQ